MGDYKIHSIYSYWIMLHIVSLGFLPLRGPNDFHYELTLYGKNRIELKKDTLNNKSSIWLWTPLILAGGSVIMNSYSEYEKVPYRNAIRHYLVQIESSKLIE